MLKVHSVFSTDYSMCFRMSTIVKLKITRKALVYFPSYTYRDWDQDTNRNNFYTLLAAETMKNQENCRLSSCAILSKNVLIDFRQLFFSSILYLFVKKKHTLVTIIIIIFFLPNKIIHIIIIRKQKACTIFLSVFTY